MSNFIQVFGGIPVVFSREWTTALAPNNRGGWNFITQGQTTDGTTGSNGIDPLHVDWIVVDLNLETSVVYPMDTRFQYHNDEGSFATHVGLSYQNQKRAPNGKIFFPAACNHLFVYDEATEQVTQLPQVEDTTNLHWRTQADATQYSHEFNTDGSKLYTGTQSNRLPAIIEIDTATLEARVLGHVGMGRIGFSYAYYLQPDTVTSEKWIYVVVGENPWQLCALNVVTGATRVLAPPPPVTSSIIRLVVVPEVGIRADLGPGKTNSWWCIDGAMIQYSDDYASHPLPFTARNAKPYTNPLVNPPQLDTTAGMGLVKWRPAGSTDFYSVSFEVPHPEPVDIESLLALPDGSVLGNVKNYLGFFRYDALTRSTQWFGPWQPHGVSRGPRLLVGNTVWIAGYPNGVLFAYEPPHPWDPPTNPFQHGNFSASRMKYADFMDYSPNLGRLYCAGHRQRDGFGGAIGWFDILGHDFGDTAANIPSMNPSGFVVLDDISRLVFSGRPSHDPSVPNPPPDASLVIYDMDLLEIARHTVMTGMKDAGVVFKTTTPGVIVGLSSNPIQHIPNTLYRYDVAAGTLISHVDLGVAVGPSWQDPVTGTIYAILDAKLCWIDPVSLDRGVILAADMLAGVSRFLFNGIELVVAEGHELFVLEPSLLHLRAEITGILTGAVLRVSVQSSAPVKRPLTGAFLLELIGFGTGGDALLAQASLDTISTFPKAGKFVRSPTDVAHRFIYSVALGMPPGSVTAVAVRLTDPSNLQTELIANV